MSAVRRIRPGRPLDAMDAEALVTAAMASLGLHQTLIAEGYALMPRVRPYWRQDRLISARLVWRNRAAGSTVSMSVLYPTCVRDGVLIIGDGIETARMISTNARLR
ncbi:hypothetical protein [Telmatospirillum sp. J64-1]|uniref:hypothetical protein n=1 Tax=Telmatospirillum sp. J64-1 TaxID=2502183 RepID=UPI00115D37F7|nr:hypothetical protein [Telmatospirillum sp. J64-1]